MVRVKRILIGLTILLLSGCNAGKPSQSPVNVTSPKEGQSIVSPLVVEGKAPGTWFFEGGFPIEIRDDYGTLLARGFGLAKAEWMTEDLVPFKSEIIFEKPVSAKGKLILKKANPSGLPENDEEAQLSVIFEEGQDLMKQYTLEEVASGLEIIWDFAFTSPDRILVTERPGRLRIIEKGILLQQPLHVFSDVSTTGEEGLMSVELDPDYQTNHWIYLSWAYSDSKGMWAKVARFTDQGERLEDEILIIDKLPAAQYHAGCRIEFGPDKKLYITVGDALDKEKAQDLEALEGKTLRLNADGSIPDDNPFPNSPVWSYGHRNSQGIAWHPETGAMYESEHGPSVFDGPPGGDEINLIIKGGNYGWPVITHKQTQEGMISPMIVFDPAEPPASLILYSGKAIPAYKNNLFFGSLKGEGIMRLVLTPHDPAKIMSSEKLPDIHLGRIRAMAESPDGIIYFGTSNRDGRAEYDPKDDRVFRLKPL